MFEEYNSHDVAVYGGFLDEDTKILRSTSGGVATALSEYMLSEGGYVAGVAYSEDFYKAEYIVTNSVADIDRLKGSKYVDCDKNDVYSKVKELLASGEKVLFFGLPCVVAALYKFIGDRPENLLTCELICHGPTYPEVHREYVDFLEKKYNNKIVDFSVRYKIDSWTPAYLYAKFANGKTFMKPFYQTEYGFAFSVLGKKSCYDCRFKGNNRQADIMLGDFWGATDKDEYWNRYGVSSVFAETLKGDAFLKKTPGIKLFPSTFEKVAVKNPRLISSKTCDERRDRFAALLKEMGLIYAVNHTMSTKGKIKRVIEKLVPSSVIQKIKRVLLKNK